MVFGHNTNVTSGSVTYHVQTEDRGESHALIDTTVYYHGRVLHRRTNNYFDLLPLNEDRAQALKLRLDEQHHTVLEEIQSGLLQLPIPHTPPVAALPIPAAQLMLDPPTQDSHDDSLEPAAPIVVSLPRKLNVELMNPKSWFSGKHATLQISVKEENGDPVADAKIDVHIEGSAEHPSFSALSGLDGHAQIEFAMPRITGAEAALVILAEENEGHGQLRFALRAKPKVPTL